MRIAIPKEMGEARVALTPHAVPKLAALGLEILVERGAGIGASFPDEAYDGAILLSRRELINETELLLSISPLPNEELKQLRKQTAMVAQFEPFNRPNIIEELRAMSLRAFSLDMIPRTTLAQSMDVLSSMASIAGYQAMLEAARLLPRYFPMMITAAGSIRPAKVLVLGAGVAGLQAIATARRLGAQVEAFDTRAAAKEEVQSLGAKFVEVEGARDEKGAGGYAVEQSEDFLKRQREEVQARAIKADVIVATAQVRGRRAPMLIPQSTVDQMKSGSVIVDLASSSGGNCELSQDNKTISYRGVTIVGNSNLPALLPQDASFLYANNVVNFLNLLVTDGQLNIDLGNEIIRGAYITAEQ